MLAWLESIAGSAYATAMLWTLGALLLLIVILLLIKVVRSLSFGTFVSGGRNRKARLAVMDATAVDSHRRLVLVRRDDVEHLLLIGGPSDVVVEQNIRLVGQGRRPAQDEAPPPRELRMPPDAPAAAPVPAVATAPEREDVATVNIPAEAVRPAPQPAPVAPRPYSAPQAPTARPVQPAPAPRPAPAPAVTAAPRPVVANPAAAVAARPAAPASATPVASSPLQPAVAPPVRPAPPRPVNDQPPSLDDSLLQELEVTLDRTAAEAAGKALPSSVDEEMEKLLGDLARPRR